jgi:hypothetical protein
MFVWPLNELPDFLKRHLTANNFGYHGYHKKNKQEVMEIARGLCAAVLLHSTKNSLEWLTVLFYDTRYVRVKPDRFEEITDRQSGGTNWGLVDGLWTHHLIDEDSGAATIGRVYIEVRGSHKDLDAAVQTAYDCFEPLDPRNKFNTTPLKLRLTWTKPAGSP